MKLGILGDLHIHSKAPERRLDEDYLETCRIKLHTALSLLEGCEVLIQVGDFFDSYAVSNRVTAMAIDTIRSMGRVVYCIYGQHDISGHSSTTIHNSPLQVMRAAGAIHLLDDCPVTTRSDQDFVTMYGASFGQDVPEVTTKGFNILVTHRMIGDRPLYPGQELVGPRSFLRKYSDYDLVCCGDYHYRFDDSIQDRVILNPGVMMRKTLKEAELEHIPAVYEFDTQGRKFKIIPIPCQPLSEVMDLARKDRRDVMNLEEFIGKLQSGTTAQIGWKSILLDVMDQRKTSSQARELISDSMSKLEE